MSETEVEYWTQCSKSDSKADTNARQDKKPSRIYPLRREDSERGGGGSKDEEALLWLLRVSSNVSSWELLSERSSCSVSMSAWFVALSSLLPVRSSSA